jgi:hypothetical protein
MPYFMNRPQIVNAIQWTGNNKSEVEGWAATNATWATQFIKDGDVLRLPLNGFELHPGDYLTSNWYIASDQVQWYQEVPNANHVFSTEEES